MTASAAFALGMPMPHAAGARPILLALALAMPLAGCVENMHDLKDTLGYAPPPPPLVAPLAPVAFAEANLTLTSAGAPVRFSAERSHDPDGEIASYSWDFGDGTVALGDVVSHAFARAGEFGVRLTATDDSGLAATDIVTVTVRALNRAPVATIVLRDEAGALARTSDVGRAMAFDAGASSDPDGNPIEFAWDFGDGATSLAPTARHAFKAPGQYVVTLVVRDALGATGRASETVGIGARAAWHGDFAPTALPGESQSFPLAVPDGLASATFTLRFPATLGLADLTLTVLDARGATVAATNATTEPLAQGDAVRSLALASDALAGHAAGEWKLVVTKAKGLDVAFDVDAALRY